jgi:hypothetical protein
VPSVAYIHIIDNIVPDFLRSSESVMGSAQPREYN